MWKLHEQTITVEAGDYKFAVTFWRDGCGLRWFSVEEVVETSWRLPLVRKSFATTNKYPVRSGWTEDNRVELVVATIRQYLSEDRKIQQEKAQIDKLCQSSSCKLVELDQSMISEVQHV